MVSCISHDHYLVSILFPGVLFIVAILTNPSSNLIFLICLYIPAFPVIITYLIVVESFLGDKSK